MRAMSFVQAVVVSLALVSVSSAATLVTLNDFATSADFTNNFSVVLGTVSHNAADDGGAGAGGFVTTTGNWHDAVVYDTDAAQGGAHDIFGTQFSIDLDARINAGIEDGGIGFYFLGDGTRNSKDWVFFQVNSPNPASSERVRFFSGRDMGGFGGAMVSDQTADSSLTTGQWMHLRLNVDVNGSNQAAVTLSGYDSQTVFDSSTLKFQKSYTYAAGNTAVSEIGISLFADTLNAVDIDNFTVTGVPEPCSMTLVALGMIGLLAYAWRNRR